MQLRNHTGDESQSTTSQNHGRTEAKKQHNTADRLVPITYVFDFLQINMETVTAAPGVGHGKSQKGATE